MSAADLGAGERAGSDDAGGDRVRAVVFKNRGALLAAPALALVVFGRPSPTSALLGLPLAFAGEAIRCWGVGYSGATTRSDRVTAPMLVTAGPYAHVRNPLYLGNLVTAAGFAVAFTGGLPPLRRALLAGAGLGIAVGVYAAIVPLEEAYLRRTFGAAFEEYVARVPRIVPRRRPVPGGSGRYEPSVIRRAESRTFVTFGAMLAALALKMARGR